MVIETVIAIAHTGTMTTLKRNYNYNDWNLHYGGSKIKVINDFSVPMVLNKY